MVGGRDRDFPKPRLPRHVEREHISKLGLEVGQLGDVDFPAPPTDGQALVWSDTANSWLAGDVAGGGGSGLQILVEVINPSTTDVLPRNAAVYVSGEHTSGKPLVSLADASDPNKMPAIGLLLADVGQGGEGYAIAAGNAEGLQLHSQSAGGTYNDGDALYVSPTSPGELTNVRPTSSAHKVQKVALVTKTSPTSSSNAGYAIVMGAGRVNDQNNEIVALIGRRNEEGFFVGTTTDTTLGASPGDPVADNSTIYDALTAITQDLGVPNNESVTTPKIDDGAVTREKLAVEIDSSVLLTHVTNTGSVTSVTLQQGGQALGESSVGVPLDRACTSSSAVVSWRADTAPAGTWTLTLKKKAAGSRNYTTAATMSVTVNNG